MPRIDSSPRGTRPRSRAVRYLRAARRLMITSGTYAKFAPRGRRPVSTTLPGKIKYHVASWPPILMWLARCGFPATSPATAGYDTIILCIQCVHIIYPPGMKTKNQFLRIKYRVSVRIIVTSHTRVFLTIGLRLTEHGLLSYKFVMWRFSERQNANHILGRSQCIRWFAKYLSFDIIWVTYLLET